MMDLRKVRQKRLERLLDLAQAYRQVSRKQLARTLGRNPTKVVPGSGIPKLDLVVELAAALDWPIDAVVSCIWVDDPPTGGSSVNGSGFDGLEQASREAQVSGRYAEAVELARTAFAGAESPEQRALACNREAVGWDGLGQYATALEATQRGLQEPSISPALRRILESNLANSYYTLWSLAEARSLSHALVDWYDAHEVADLRERSTRAFARYVRGHACRRLIIMQPESADDHAAAALDDLETAVRHYGELAAETGEDSYGGIANTCRGGIIEAEVQLDRRDAESALDRLAEGLEAVVDPEKCPAGDWLESYGWWCIFGCNVALRHLSDERRLQHYMAVFTEKADEIGQRLDNWALRERVFTMEYVTQQRFLRWTGRMLPVTLDEADLRALVGTMARFPLFRDKGWKLLETAKVVRDN